MFLDAIHYIKKIDRNLFDATLLALQVESYEAMMQSIAALKSKLIYLMQSNAIHYITKIKNHFNMKCCPPQWYFVKLERHLETNFPEKERRLFSS